MCGCRGEEDNRCVGKNVDSVHRPPFFEVLTPAQMLSRMREKRELQVEEEWHDWEEEEEAEEMIPSPSTSKRSTWFQRQEETVEVPPRVIPARPPLGTTGKESALLDEDSDSSSHAPSTESSLVSPMSDQFFFTKDDIQFSDEDATTPAAAADKEDTRHARAAVGKNIKEDTSIEAPAPAPPVEPAQQDPDPQDITINSLLPKLGFSLVLVGSRVFVDLVLPNSWAYANLVLVGLELISVNARPVGSFGSGAIDHIEDYIVERADDFVFFEFLMADGVLSPAPVLSPQTGSTLRRATMSSEELVLRNLHKKVTDRLDDDWRRAAEEEAAAAAMWADYVVRTMGKL